MNDKSFNALPNLAVRVTKKTGSRKTGPGSKADDVTEKLAGCQTPAEVRALAIRFGKTSEDITSRGKTAANFGQFRMTVGNLIRGVINRYNAAGQAGKITDYAYAKRKQAKPAAKKDAPKASKKAAKKKARKKVVKKKAAKKKASPVSDAA